MVGVPVVKTIFFSNHSLFSFFVDRSASFSHPLAHQNLSTKMMAAASSGVRALTKGDAKSWLIFKCIVAVFCAPLAVFMELHAFDKVALILYGISTLLWLFGWLPGELRGGSHAGWGRVGVVGAAGGGQARPDASTR